MATPRKSWPKGAEADRVGAVDSQRIILDSIDDARTLIRDASAAVHRQDWRLLEMIFLRLDSLHSDIRAEAMSALLALESAKHGEG